MKLLFLVAAAAALALGAGLAGGATPDADEVAAAASIFGDAPGCEKIDWAKMLADDSCDDFNNVRGTACSKACKAMMKAWGPACYRGMSQSMSSKLNINITKEKTAAMADATYKACLDGRPNPQLMKTPREEAEEAAQAYGSIKGCEHANWTLYLAARKSDPGAHDVCMSELKAQIERSGRLSSCPDSCKPLFTIGTDCYAGMVRQANSGLGLELDPSTMQDIDSSLRKLGEVCPTSGALSALGRPAVRAALVAAAWALALLAVLG